MTFKKGELQGFAKANKGKGAALKWILEHKDYAGPDCLIWPFGKGTGYGYFSENGNTHRAHKFMCQLVNGDPPSPEHQAAHNCGNGRRGCCHPKHVEWKTNGQNQLDRRKHGTANHTGGRGKLTMEQVAIIRALRGIVTQTDLSKLCGVTHSTIQYAQYTANKTPMRRSSRAAHA